MRRYRQGPFVTERGRGIGSVLGALFRAVIPVASRIGRTILKSPITKGILHSAKTSAIEAATSLASDVLRGNNVKEGLQRNLELAKHRVADVIDSSRSVPTQKPSSSSGASKRRKRKAKTIDIFDNE